MTHSEQDLLSRPPSDEVDDWGRASFPASDPPSGWAGRDDVAASRRLPTPVRSGLDDANSQQQRFSDEVQLGP
jgi:hypothetical protein